MIRKHRSYKYACSVIQGEVPAPRYVVVQCAEFKAIADGGDAVYCLNEKLLGKIDALLKIMILAKGLRARQSIYKAAVGWQMMFWVAVLCTVYRADKHKRRYETEILEIARKNFKTATVAVLFVLLMALEPKFSKFFSVAPDGTLSREVKSAIEEIIAVSPELCPEGTPEALFKVRRDDIFFKPKHNNYIPLNYSNSRLDGRLPSAFVVDETGALPNPYAIEAMRSGQLTIENKLGCIISTKYPKAVNPFEDEVAYAKRVLDGVVNDEKVFALLYEPDDIENWSTNDEILAHANPAALEIPEIMEDIKAKRKRAIEQESARENFITKHCNIIYQGIGTEGYIPINELQACKVEDIDWKGREVYVGVDLSMSNDNCAVAIVSEEDGSILADVTAFIPADRVDEKSAIEDVDYTTFIRGGKCVACGDKIIDYAVIEDYVFDLEEKRGVVVVGIAYDRFNAMSSAQKWERGRPAQNGKPEHEGMDTVVVRQHSDTLHPPTKLLAECVAKGRFQYTENKLMEINFENARCTYDTNLNRYVNKKRSNGKVDEAVAIINAVYLLQQKVFFGEEVDWAIQTG